ncbi:hypothetical protein JL720_12445 [Aureococcus anophagefferens]|nr:hypothetical protein JL720_12445 [Aureococcus anophagefferens]
MVSVHRRLVALCVVGVVGVARGRETRLAKASGPPSFFLQDAAADGLCLGDGAFKRCGIDTLWYVTGSAGAYSIHKRKVDDVDEDLCLDRASCDLPEPGDADVEPHKDDVTALQVAAQGGHLACVSLLLDAGADVRAVDEEGMSAANAAQKNHGDAATSSSRGR